LDKTVILPLCLPSTRAPERAGLFGAPAVVALVADATHADDPL